MIVLKQIESVHACDMVVFSLVTLVGGFVTAVGQWSGV